MDYGISGYLFQFAKVDCRNSKHLFWFENLMLLSEYSGLRDSPPTRCCIHTTQVYTEKERSSAVSPPSGEQANWWQAPTSVLFPGQGAVRLPWLCMSHSRVLLLVPASHDTVHALHDPHCFQSPGTEEDGCQINQVKLPVHMLPHVFS